MRTAPRPSRSLRAGFSLVEMIVVVFLLGLAMLGILSVFDASARINKNEQDIADAQGAVRYGIYTMTRAIRMAGAGGLFVTQAVLNHADPQLPGITVVNSVQDNSYDNVEDGTKVAAVTGGDIPVRPGTDMIEVRGVINSPLLGFDPRTGCEPCNDQGCGSCLGTTSIRAAATTQNLHVNQDTTNRPQFSQIDDYTAGAGSGNSRMLVLVAFNDEVHAGCTFNVGVLEYPLYPQPSYNVGSISAKTTLLASSSFGQVNFTDTIAEQFNPETPEEAAAPPQDLKNVRRAGILDDLIYFIDNSNPLHPALAQGTRRGEKFDVVTLADDVEDVQVAYGVDLPDPNTGQTNNAIDPSEWSPDGTPNQAAYTTANFRDPVSRCPRLHGVSVSLVAKSHDPDPTYRMSSARILPMMNSPLAGSPAGYPQTAVYTGSPGHHYRRRIQTLRINLRNYAYGGG